MLQKNIQTIVNEQLEAYKTRNLERFLDTLADDIILYDFPDTILANGKKAMRSLYGQIFTDLPHMQLTHTNRVVIDNRVIDYQEIQNWYDNATMKMLVIYEIQNNKIQKAWLVRSFQ